LTQKEIKRLYEIINSLKKSGVAVIFVSHKLDEIFAVCDRIFVIRNGEAVADYPVDEFQQEKLAYYMTGSHIIEEKYSPENISEEYIFEVKDLTYKNYFRKISFGVRKGDILCLTGRLGSGRLELAKALFGVLPVTEGEIFLKGKRLSVGNITEAIENRIAYIPEDRLSEGLFLDAIIRNNLSAVVLKRLAKKIGFLKEKDKEKMSNEWIERLSIKARSGDAAHTLSGGNQQRVVLAKWMASSPELFILNCPTMGVDVKSKYEIHTIIKKMAKEGVAVLMVSDDIGEILYNSNRVLVINEGEITFESDTQNITYKDLSDKITEGV
jgi:simple sugar transport system ATP-binding protein